MSDEKYQDMIAPAQSSTESVDIGKVDLENNGEIFKGGEGIEDFRTVSWVHTSVIFLKRKAIPFSPSNESVLHWLGCSVIFATGVLTIPSAMYTLGAFPGAINVLGWQGLNTWCALCGNGDIATHGGGNEAEGCSVEGALASGYIHKYAK
jgi:hypothetical protein